MKTSSLLLVAGLTLSSTLIASDRGTKFVTPAPFAVSVDYTMTKIDYREYDGSGAILDSEKADSFKGFGAEGKAKIGSGILGGNANYVQVSYNRTAGNTEYVGALLSGGAYGSYVGTTENTITEYNLMFTENFITKEYDFWIGAGVGHREWERTLSPNQNEIYKWAYWNAEIGGSYHFNEYVSLGLVYNYRKVINPEMDTEVTGWEDMTFDLGGVKGYTIAVPLHLNINKDLSFYTEYERESFDISKSNVVTITAGSFIEPDSTTEIDRIKVGFRYKFGN